MLFLDHCSYSISQLTNKIISDLSSRPRSPSIRSIRRQGSVLSGISTASEAGRSDYRKTPSQEPNSSFTPQQLGVMGKLFYIQSGIEGRCSRPLI